MIDSLSPAVSAGAWAHALIAHADPREEIVAYGDPQELLVGVGTRAYLAIGADGVIHRSRRLPDTGDPWSAIERFLDQADGKPVLGHLGSDLHRLDEPRLRGSAYPATWLAVPRLLPRRRART